MEAENAAKKHLRGATEGSLIPCIRARLFLTRFQPGM